MRKLYSLVLMAAMLLVSGQMKAAVENVSNFTELQSKITAAAPMSTVELKLTTDIQMNAGITIGTKNTASSGKTVIIDLNGHNITSPSVSTMFIVNNGSLEFKGTGNIEQNNASGTAIDLYGSTNAVDSNFTILTIGQNVRLTSAKYALVVTENGTGSDAVKVAYGVKAIVNGYIYGAKYGMKVNGSITANTGKVPEMYVNATAEIASSPNQFVGDGKESMAVYASGYAKWFIKGYIHGDIAVYIKSGQVVLEDALVQSDNTQATHTSIVGQGSGAVGGGGTAIVVESNPSYAGGQDVTITGDTKVVATNGYALEETNTTGGETKVETIHIEGGTFEGGDEGCMAFTEGTAKDNPGTVTVVGANLEGGVVIENAAGDSVGSVESIVPTGYHTTTIVDGDGNATVVISQGTAPDPAVTYNINDAALPTDGVVVLTAGAQSMTNNVTVDVLEMTNATVLTIAAGKTLTANKIIMGMDAQIIVPSDGKLVVLGNQGVYAPSTSNIVLQAIEGAAAQFLLKPEVASNRHPNATVQMVSNSYTTSSTVYMQQRFGIPTHNQVKNITAKSITTDADVAVYFLEFDGVWKSIGYINYTTPLDYTRLATPFGYRAMQCNNSVANDTRVSFEGELFGNDNALLTMEANGWSSFANSYCADMKCTEMLNMFNDVEGANPAVYLATPVTGTDNNYTWAAVNFTTMLVNPTYANSLKLQPMGAFIVNNESAVSAKIALNYKTMVWDPVMTPAPAPRRMALSNASNFVMNIANANATDNVYFLEADQFSSDIDNGYDAEKYMNEGCNIYVTNNGKYATMATDDLNNTYVGFSCVNGGVYTINFDNCAGRNFVLVDLVNNSSIAIAEGATYTFTANDNESNDYRFKIVERNEMPTDVETVENNAVRAAGIYTISGQYVGEMNVWNTLPAGLYIVNGEKMVK